MCYGDIQTEANKVLSRMPSKRLFLQAWSVWQFFFVVVNLPVQHPFPLPLVTVFQFSYPFWVHAV